MPDQGPTRDETTRPPAAPAPEPPRPDAGAPPAPAGSPTTGARAPSAEEGAKLVSQVSNHLVDEIGTVIVGKTDVLRKITVGLLTGGHILFEDFPGLAKTLMSNLFATALGCQFSRIQFTPDLLPGDITGSYVYDQRQAEFSFRKGPLFTNVLLADEINRAPPKTQAALLEAMQEGQATIEGHTHTLPKPFVVFATQNPIEYEGTYPLPEAQMDRFIMRLSVGYPSEADEAEILARRDERRQDRPEVRTLADPATVERLKAVTETIHLAPEIRRYIARIVVRTREDPRTEVGSSPRGSLALFKLAKANAAYDGRRFATPDDVKALAVDALAHRIILTPEARLRDLTAQDVIRDIVAQTPVEEPQRMTQREG